MAKRYIKIGWENKPSVKTPVNMANLGRMDKGIDDCDNAIEEIYSKRVNNVVTTNEDTFLAGPVGKFLQDQVDELNKNLATQPAYATVFENGWTGGLTFTKYGNGLIAVTGYVVPGTITAGTLVLKNFPEGFRPKNNFSTRGYVNNITTPAIDIRFGSSPDHAIYIQNAATSGLGIYLNCVYS